MTEQKEIKILHDGMEVIYNVGAQKWTYAGVFEDTVKILSPEKHAAISVALRKGVIEYQERLASEEAVRKAKALADRVQKIDAFTAEVNPLIPAGFTAKFGDPNSEYCCADDFALEKGGRDARISFEGRIYSGSRSDFGGHRATLPWMVRFANRRHRFATLEKAIKNAAKNIEEKLQEQVMQKKAVAEKMSLNQTLEKTLNDCGITMKIETSGHHDGRHWVNSESRVARITIVKPDSEYSQYVGISGQVYEEKGKPVLYHVAIKGAFTPEQFKKLAEFVKTLSVKKA